MAVLHTLDDRCNDQKHSIMAEMSMHTWAVAAYLFGQVFALLLDYHVDLCFAKFLQMAGIFSDLVS
jgi:hypothetical protein